MAAPTLFNSLDTDVSYIRTNHTKAVSDRTRTRIPSIDSLEMDSLTNSEESFQNQNHEIYSKKHRDNFDANQIMNLLYEAIEKYVLIFKVYDYQTELELFQRIKNLRFGNNHHHDHFDKVSLASSTTFYNSEDENENSSSFEFQFSDSYFTCNNPNHPIWKTTILKDLKAKDIYEIFDDQTQRFLNFLDDQLEVIRDFILDLDELNNQNQIAQKLRQKADFLENMTITYEFIIFTIPVDIDRELKNQIFVNDILAKSSRKKFMFKAFYEHYNNLRTEIWRKSAQFLFLNIGQNISVENISSLLGLSSRRPSNVQLGRPKLKNQNLAILAQLLHETVYPIFTDDKQDMAVYQNKLKKKIFSKILESVFGNFKILVASYFTDKNIDSDTEHEIFEPNNYYRQPNKNLTKISNDIYSTIVGNLRSFLTHFCTETKIFYACEIERPSTADRSNRFRKFRWQDQVADETEDKLTCMIYNGLLDKISEYLVEEDQVIQLEQSTTNNNNFLSASEPDCFPRNFRQFLLEISKKSKITQKLAKIKKLTEFDQNYQLNFQYDFQVNSFYASHLLLDHLEKSDTSARIVELLERSLENFINDLVKPILSQKTGHSNIKKPQNIRILQILIFDLCNTQPFDQRNQSTKRSSNSKIQDQINYLASIENKLITKIKNIIEISLAEMVKTYQNFLLFSRLFFENRSQSTQHFSLQQEFLANYNKFNQMYRKYDEDFQILFDLRREFDGDYGQLNLLESTNNRFVARPKKSSNNNNSRLSFYSLQDSLSRYSRTSFQSLEDIEENETNPSNMYQKYREIINNIILLNFNSLLISKINERIPETNWKISQYKLNQLNQFVNLLKSYHNCNEIQLIERKIRNGVQIVKNGRVSGFLRSPSSIFSGGSAKEVNLGGRRRAQSKGCVLM